MKLFTCLSCISYGQYFQMQKICLSEGLKKSFKKGGQGDLLQKVCFLSMGGLNLRAMHVQENYEADVHGCSSK